MARYGLIVDVGRCSGCLTCVLACKHENLTEPGVSWTPIFELEVAALNHIAYFRYGCMHCDKPPCVEACPEDAIYKHPGGTVLVDNEKCKSHGECVRACPYRVMNINSGNAYFGEPLPFEKARDGFRSASPGKPSICTMCIHRIEQGKEPACVEGCPSRALIFGDLEAPGSLIADRISEAQSLLSHKGTNPRVSYIIPGDILELMELRILEKRKTAD